MGLPKIRKLLHNKRLKKQTTEWQKNSACYTSDKGLITRIYRERTHTKILPKNQEPNEEMDK
jgi:hypothetical protein